MGCRRGVVASDVGPSDEPRRCGHVSGGKRLCTQGRYLMDLSIVLPPFYLMDLSIVLPPLYLMDLCVTFPLFYRVDLHVTFPPFSYVLYSLPSPPPSPSPPSPRLLPLTPPLSTSLCIHMMWCGCNGTWCCYSVAIIVIADGERRAEERCNSAACRAEERCNSAASIAEERCNSAACRAE